MGSNSGETVRQSLTSADDDDEGGGGGGGGSDSFLLLCVLPPSLPPSQSQASEGVRATERPAKFVQTGEERRGEEGNGGNDRDFEMQSEGRVACAVPRPPAARKSRKLKWLFLPGSWGNVLL